MAPSTWAGIAGVIVAAGTFIAVVVNAYTQYKSSRRTEDRLDAQQLKVTAVAENVEKVHVIVNQQRTDMLDVIAYQKKIIDQLEREKREDREASE